MELLQPLTAEINVQRVNSACDWKALYRAAVLEDDGSRLHERIATARHALDVRATALFDVGEEKERRQEMEEISRATRFLDILASHPEVLTASSAAS
jgi:hypothetical protein